jgi:hypothetical protein
MGIWGWARKFLPVITCFLPKFLCIGIGIPLPVLAPTRADPEAIPIPIPALQNIILTFACFFNQCCVCLLLSKMF